MSWLYKVLLLAAVAWSFVMLPLGQNESVDGAAALLGGLLVLVVAAIVAATRPAHAGTGWFVRYGHLAWAAAVPLVLVTAALLYPLYQMNSGPGTSAGLMWFIHGLQLAVLAVVFFLVGVGTVHGSRFSWSDRRRRDEDGALLVRRHAPGFRRVVRATGIALVGVGLFIALLGALVTLIDPSASDYWMFGRLAAPASALLGAGLWFLASHEPAAGTVVVVEA